MKRWKQFCCAALAAAVAAALAGCGGSAPKPTATLEVPQVTPAPEKVAAPAGDGYKGYSLRLQPARGPEVIVTEPACVSLIMEAYSTDRLTVKEAAGKFDNRIAVLDPNGKEKLRFTVSSDGLMLMKAEDGRAFFMPQYVYYLLEQRLWEFNGTLKKDPLRWQPPAEGEDPDTALLETELDRLIKAAMLPAYGYSMAYFESYKLYGVNTDTADTVKVYVLLTYAGYDIQGTLFGPRFLTTTPASLIFRRNGGDTWRLTGFKTPERAKEEATSAERRALIRKIFPFDYMDEVMEDLKDPSALTKDVMRQATDYLREQQLTGLTVGS